MALDEGDFFNHRNDTRTDKLACPRCKRTNDYQMQWVVRTRKDRIPPGADERDRALFAKLRDYMIRVDECGDVQDVRQAVRHPVAAFDGLFAGRRQGSVARQAIPPDQYQ